MPYELCGEVGGAEKRPSVFDVECEKIRLEIHDGYGEQVKFYNISGVEGKIFIYDGQTAYKINAIEFCTCTEMTTVRRK